MLYIEDFLNDLKLERNYSQRTIDSYKEDLLLWEKYLLEEHLPEDPENIESEDIKAWVMHMIDSGQKATSACRRLSTLRSFYRYLLSVQKTTHDPTRQLQGPKKEKPLPYFLKEKEINRLLDDIPCDGTFAAVQDRLIVEIFYETGIRLSELQGLNIDDINFSSSTLRVTGKRNKQRIIPFGEELRRDMLSFLELREKNNFTQSRALICDKSGNRMSAGQIRKHVKAQLSLVSTQKKLSPHVLRHTFATSMLNNSANLEVVKELLGHESLSTTEIYTHTTFEELKKVYNKAHPRS